MKAFSLKNLGLIILILVIISNDINSQVLISNTTGSPDASAMLEVKSTSGGLLIPRMTSAQRTAIDNGTGDPTEGLLVFDTDDDSFYIFENGEWTNLSMSAEIWSQNSSYVYLTNSTNNVGIGTTSPGSKLVIQADQGADLDDVLFEVLDESGNPIFEVTSIGARIYVIDPDEAGTATTGGFAVGEYNTLKDKGITPCFSTDPEETRVYSANATTGGFAVGEYNTLKAAGDNYMFMVPDNYFIGHQAGEALQTGGYSGIYNTFFGYQSGLIDTVGSNNVFIGHKTGYSNTDGGFNVFLGNNAGYNNTGEGGGISGSQNVFLGYEAGYSNTTGADNVMIGWLAGRSNTTAGSNICIGSKSGYSNDTSIHNIFIGEFAGEYHKSGESNIYMGFSAGQGPTTPTGGTGEKNVYIGLEAGVSNTSGNANVFLGNQSGHDNTTGLYNVFLGNTTGFSNIGGANNVILGNQAGYFTTNGNNNVFLGNDAGSRNAGGGDNVYIGNLAGYYSQDLFNNIFMGCDAGRNATGGNNNIFLGVGAGRYHKGGNDNVMLGDSAGLGNTAYSGTSTRNVLIGTDAGKYIDDAIDNIFIGHKAGEGIVGSSIDGDYNVVIGEQAGNKISTGSQNVFLGNETGFYTTEGTGNIFIGYRCGYSNSSGDYNSFMGYQAGRSNTDGSGNMFLGYYAGDLNTTGNYNTFIGHRAGESNNADQNTFIGSSAGYQNTTGSSNIFLGWTAGASNTEGQANVFIGTQAGAANLTTHDNVYIGSNAGGWKRGGYNTYIGMQAGYGNGNRDGNYNVTMGYQSGFNMQSSYNVILGTQAGYSVQGDGNVHIGYRAGFSETGGNTLYIDNSSTSTPLIYGDFNADSLRIYGTLSFNEGSEVVHLPHTNGTTGQVMIALDDNGNMGWETSSTLYDNDWTVSGNNMSSAVTGNIGIGSAAIANNKLYVYRSSTEYGNGNTTIYGYRSGVSGETNGGTSWAVGGIDAAIKGYSYYGNNYTAGIAGYSYHDYDNSAAIVGANQGGSYSAFLAYRDGDSNYWSGYFNGNVYSSGNLGIGTTTPGDKIHVSGTGDVSTKISAGNGSNASLKLFELTSSVDYGYEFNYDGTPDRLDLWKIGFGGSNAVIMSCFKDGTIVLGETTDNAYKFKVTGGNYGIIGDLQTSSGTVYAITGYAPTSTSNYAGYFSGNVNVTGTLSKGGGSFKIDHPLDPENKYLCHSFVESPDMMNIYNGNVILDEMGEAIVTMPDWFEALNMEFRYQLTALGAPGPNLYIAEEISGNKFKIAGGTPGMKVSWQVTGIRHDAFAEENRIEVEINKNNEERGKYLHPEAFGKSTESGIDFNKHREE